MKLVCGGNLWVIFQGLWRRFIVCCVLKGEHHPCDATMLDKTKITAQVLLAMRQNKYGLFIQFYTMILLTTYGYTLSKSHWQ